MPITITDIEKKYSINFNGPNKWNSMINSKKPGIYIVSLCAAKNFCYSIKQCPIDIAQIDNWIANVYNKIRLYGKLPTKDLLLQYISSFWLPDESILYVGSTLKRGLSRRIQEFYGHRIGNAKPHSGGHWLLLLTCLYDLYIYWYDWESSINETLKEPKDLEEDILSFYYTGVGSLPFGNRRSKKLKTKCPDLKKQVFKK